jgi:hypothetical protein
MDRKKRLLVPTGNPITSYIQGHITPQWSATVTLLDWCPQLGNNTAQNDLIQDDDRAADARLKVCFQQFATQQLSALQ